MGDVPLRSPIQGRNGDPGRSAPQAEVEHVAITPIHKFDDRVRMLYQELGYSDMDNNTGVTNFDSALFRSLHNAYIKEDPILKYDYEVYEAEYLGHRKGLVLKFYDPKSGPSLPSWKIHLHRGVVVSIELGAHEGADTLHIVINTLLVLSRIFSYACTYRKKKKRGSKSGKPAEFPAHRQWPHIINGRSSIVPEHDNDDFLRVSFGIVVANSTYDTMIALKMKNRTEVYMESYYVDYQIPMGGYGHVMLPSSTIGSITSELRISKETKDEVRNDIPVSSKEEIHAHYDRGSEASLSAVPGSIPFGKDSVQHTNHENTDAIRKERKAFKKARKARYPTRKKGKKKTSKRADDSGSDDDSDTERSSCVVV